MGSRGRIGDVTCPDDFGVVDLQSQLPRPGFLINDIVDSHDTDASRGRRQLGSLIPRHGRQRDLVRRQELSVDRVITRVRKDQVKSRTWEKGYNTSQSPLFSSMTGTAAVTPSPANPSVMAFAIPS